ncbi:TPA: hotdog family protein [Burkholderia territorii]|uniref:hotdog family protein n=1 Tax=Burkholderia territorii TaxID=1503055 RepID=UPI0011C852E2|nr:hotdog family protein [Burkholderia territorii]TXG19802.1 3-hydroxylacyl-ACP dehydratase [Burkholderia territorii]HDR8861990.1 hotdog family protein [Burkholderia territorii]HDR8868111.1 hotdog family protein [Burkholderia territorii]HDR8874351.1 hotdog family protein [Burkholderia territorii]HDR8880488.1 hotdog family protein [Burkholderia territorii]
MTTPVSTLVPEPTAATLDRAWIAAHIPHDGAMCLLDRVEAWDAARIRCSATSHRDPRNPLRSHGRLASVCGIEYAAQAMAVHGALLSTQCAQTEFARPRAGYLASMRNIDAFVDRLDTFELPLIVDAERIGGDDRSVLYGFTLRCGERVLLGGRAVVMLDASAAGVLVPPPAGRADIR